MVLLRFRKDLRRQSGIPLRSCRHARFMVCIVQCFRGRPTLLVEEMFGRAPSPLKVAFLVGAVTGSRSVCTSSLCCAAFTWVDTLSMRFLFCPKARAAFSLTCLLVLALSMYVVCILRIFRSPFSWKVSSLRSCALVRYMVSSAYVSLVFTIAL